MPRRDRRFTAEDLARLYCRHLSTPQKILLRALMEDCAVGSKPSDAAVAEVLDLLADVLSDLGIPLVPIALKLLAAAVANADPSRIEEIIDTMGFMIEPTA